MDLQTSKFVMVATGEGATAQVLSGEPHQGVHDFMCFCGHQWQECKDDLIREDVKLIDYPGSWTHDEAGEPFSVIWNYETTKVGLYRLTENGGAA